MGRANKDLKVITIGNVQYLINQYADETSLFLDDTEESSKVCIEIIRVYGNMSGLVIWIGAKKQCYMHTLIWTGLGGLSGFLELLSTHTSGKGYRVIMKTNSRQYSALSESGEAKHYSPR